MHRLNILEIIKLNKVAKLLVTILLTGSCLNFVPINASPQDISSFLQQNKRQGNPLKPNELKINTAATEMKGAVAPPAEEKKEEGYVINFNNVNISEFIRFVSRITNKNFVFQETDLGFTVTIVSEIMTSEEDVMSALLQILQIRGLSLLEQGNNLIIYRNANISKFGEVVTHDDPNMAEESPIVTRVYRLQYTSPDRVKPIIQPMLSGQAIIEVSSETRHLIVTDIATTIEKVTQLLKSIDIPHSSLQIQTYTSYYHSPATLIALAEKILMPIASADGTPLSLVPQSSTDTIFIISSPDMVQRTMDVFKMLDTQGTKAVSLDLPKDIKNTEFYVYKLQFYKGDKIQDALRQIGVSLAAMGQTNQDLLSTINSMQWLPTNNSLLFTGTPDSIEKVKNLLESLDVAPRQVFIEMLVIQTSLGNSLNFGVEWGFQPSYTNSSGTATTSGTTGFFNSANGGTNSASSIVGNFTIPSVQGNPKVPLGAGFDFGVIGNILRHNGQVFGTLGALVNAIQTENNTQIIMNPKIVTVDTNTAQLFVGTNTPFTTSTTQIDGAASSTGFTVDYRDVGVFLEVTPTLGVGDLITLDIHQEINAISSSATNTLNISSSSSTAASFPIPTTNRTTTSTRIYIPNEYFLMISGMISDNKTRTKSQLPCLGGIPWFGAAFSNQAVSNTKNNVIIFIHPRILSSPDDVGRLSDEQGEEYRKKSDPKDLPSVWDGKVHNPVNECK
ncbi:MAG: hypothetical protein JHC93_02635 [Parachlamydiales bacterium]|nr:hypothetical protein [Parachlamydiales bacterium]